MFTQFISISALQRQGFKTTRRITHIINLLAWVLLAVAVWPPTPPLGAIAGESGAAQDTEEGQALEPGTPIERELSGGQSHFYRISLTSGQYLQIAVSQRGIDVLVALYATDGKKIGEANSAQLTVESETMSVIADETGTYRIEVRSSESAAKTGRYEIKVETLRDATAEDKYRVAAETIYREAGQLEKGTLGARRKGIEKYLEALELYRKIGDREWEAKTLIKIGEVYYLLGELQKALEKFNQALPIYREAGDRRGEAITLVNIGTVSRPLGETQKALEKLNEAQLILREVGDRRSEAYTLVNIGSVNRSLGEMRNALDKYQEALPIIRAVGDLSGEATTLNHIGGVYWLLGEMQKALDKYNEALPIIRAVGDRRGEAMTLDNIGTVYRDLGEIQKAMEKHNEALPILRKVGDRRGEAITLNNIGDGYLSLGEAQKALERFNESLSISRALGDRIGEAVTLNNISFVYRSSGEMQKALEKLNESLLIKRAVGDRRAEAITLHNIGSVYLSLGEIQKALEKLNEALPIRRAVGDRYGEANTLLRIARSEQKQGNLAQARQTIEQAIGIIESSRTNISSRQLRASYFASRQEFYQSYIDILMQMHRQNPSTAFEAAALAVSERARARQLLELLTESRADIRQGVDRSLLERERSLQQRLSAKATTQTNLLNRKHTPAQAEAMAKEIAAITDEYDQVEAEIRKISPRYSALTQPQPLTLAEIQQQVLDPDTLLLEYSLGDEASYLFVVSQTSIASYQLPKRAEIEAATRRVRELLTAPQPKSGESATERRARIKEAVANYWPQAAALSRMLVGPAASQLGTKRLLIISDGALQYLPFGALPVPEIAGQGDGEGSLPIAPSQSLPPEGNPPRRPVSPTPLIVEHEIAHLPSASTLAILRRELAGRKPAPKAIAVLADPVFSADDGRVKLAAQNRKPQAGEETPSDLTRALTDIRGELTRLLMTRDEAQAILSLTPLNSRLEALDFRASRATGTSDDLSQYRIVHFATHGLLNSEHPELSGLVLSLVDERGQPQDGFLQLHEIFNLRLPAELVVLSACQTGLGKEIRGEGLVGLTRGFMYAGAARVMASLWQVSDAATSELMKRFYRGLLKEGKRPAAALRAAQVEMWRRPQWQAPYYWGAFVLQGEWK